MAIAPEDLILVSVDDHICEPADIFEGRLPKKYQAEAPFVSEDPNGRQQWWYQGKPGRNLGLNAAAGKPREAAAPAGATSRRESPSPATPANGGADDGPTPDEH